MYIRIVDYKISLIIIYYMLTKILVIYIVHKIPTLKKKIMTHIFQYNCFLTLRSLWLCMYFYPVML